MITDERNKFTYRDSDFHEAVDSQISGLPSHLYSRILSTCSKEKTSGFTKESTVSPPGFHEPASRPAEKRWSKSFGPFRSHRLGYALIFLFILTLGTAFAAGYQNALSQFFFKDELPYLKPDPESYLLTDSHDGISLVIDAFLPSESRYTLIASLIREDGQMWDARSAKRNMVNVSFTDLPEGFGSFGVIRPGELSEDGTRMTFILDSYEDAAIYGNEITVSINNIVLAKPSEEREIFIPLEELYSESGASFQARADDRSSANSHQTLYEKINNSQNVAPNKDFPDVILKGIGYLENYDNQYDNGLSPFFKGMYLYTENLSDTQDSHVVRKGFISEVTNIKTGEIHEIWMERSYHPQENPAGASIGFSVFEDITPEDLPHYAATKITYHEEECVEGRWEIHFTPEEKQEQKIGFYEERKNAVYNGQEIEAVYEAEFYITSVSVVAKSRFKTLSGEVLDSLYTNSSYGSLSITIHQKNGSETKLRFDGAFSLSQDPGTMLSSYIAYDGTDSWDGRHIFNLDEIEYLTVNGEQVELNDDN